jgi:hypothetical protein
MDYDELFARRVAFRVKGLAFADGFISVSLTRPALMLFYFAARHES